MPWPRGAGWRRYRPETGAIAASLFGICLPGPLAARPDAAVHRQSAAGLGIGRYLRVCAIGRATAEGRFPSTTKVILRDSKSAERIQWESPYAISPGVPHIVPSSRSRLLPLMLLSSFLN